MRTWRAGAPKTRSRCYRGKFRAIPDNWLAQNLLLFLVMLAASASASPDDAIVSPALAAGSLLFGRFTLRRVLGKGGMGAVWLARDGQLERDVALKFVGDSCFHDHAAREDLRRETRRSLELTHPNIIRIYDYLEDATTAAISMEYVEGSTLSQMRVQCVGGFFEAEDLRVWIAGVCDALDYAHQHVCIVHRDLKPANVMVNARGVAKIADLGISCGLQNTAARISAWSHTGGTLGYMSPQQLMGDLAAPSDDIYALGATLYELLTGKPPFYSGDISYQVRHVRPETIAQRREKLGIVGKPIPAVWEETIAACLAKEPADRPASIAEIADRLSVAGLNRVVPSTDNDLEKTRYAPILHPRPSKPPRRPRRPTKIRSWHYATAALVFSAWWFWPADPDTALAASRAAAAAKSPEAPALVSAPVVNAAPPVNVAPIPMAPGGLIVKSVPSGATVELNGRNAGKTPLSLQDVAAGDYQVTLTLPGFEPHTSQLAVRAREVIDTGSVALARSVGSLLIESQPQESAFTLFAVQDGEEDREIRAGRTPEHVPNLPTGKYRVRFQREPYPAETVDVNVERQTTAKTAHKFGHGLLEVVTDPPGAQVHDGEKLLGVTPLGLELPSGTHRRLSVSLVGYETRPFEARVLAGETVTVPPLLLTPEPPRLGIATDPLPVQFRVFAGENVPANASPLREGMPPVVLENIPAGKYTIVFSGGPWAEMRRVVEVGPRGLTPIIQAFPSGSIEVTSNPEGATVLVDGKEVGQAPIEVTLPPGTHEVTAEHKGRTARPRKVELAVEDTELVKFDFTTSTSSGSKTRRTRRPVNESVFTKVGRSIENFFTGGKNDKKRR